MGDWNDKLRNGYKASHVDLVDYCCLGCSPADEETGICSVGHGAQIRRLISCEVEEVVICPVFSSGDARMNVKKCVLKWTDHAFVFGQLG